MAVLIALPVILLNVFGGIVAAIWLGTNGQLSAVLIGLGILVGGVIGSIFVLAPAAFLAPAAVAALERGNKSLAYILLLISLIYTFGIFAIWGYLVFSYFISVIPQDLRLPGVIFSYAVANGLVGFLGSKEKENQQTQISSGIFMITCLVAMVVAYGIRVDTTNLKWVFGLGAVIAVLMSLGAVRTLTRYR